MTTVREAAQMALEALDSKHDMTKAEWRVLQYHAFTALREALAQPERDEAPAKAVEWQGLTNEEQMQVAWSCGAMSADWLDFARAIEAKLKEKNT